MLYVGRLWCPELIPEIEKFLPVSIFSSPDPKGQVRYCHHLASVVRPSSVVRPLTFHILIYSSETTGPNGNETIHNIGKISKSCYYHAINVSMFGSSLPPVVFIYYVIIYIWCIKCISTSATPSLFIEVPVWSQERDLLCIMCIKCDYIYVFLLELRTVPTVWHKGKFCLKK
jgi:hypothetical protein